MAVSGITSSTTTGTTDPPVVDKDKTGFNSLTSDTFLKLLITQLQNQDPTAPMGNDELLNQLSNMRNLQANIELSDTLKSFGQNEKMSSGAALLGKLITGTNADNKEITGVADRVFVQNGDTLVGIGTDQVSLGKVTGVSIAG